MSKPYEASAYDGQFDAIWQCVSEITGVELWAVSDRSRYRRINIPRQIFFYLCRIHTTASLREIGQYAGGRDHSTVIHGHKCVSDVMTYDKEFKSLVHKIENHMTGRVPPTEDPEILAKIHAPYLGFIAGA